MIARRVNLSNIVLGQYVPTCITIENTFKATVDFNIFSRPHTFTIEQWAKRGLHKFLCLFHSTKRTDVAAYGVTIEDAEGGVSLYEDTTDITLHSDGSFTIGTNAKPMTVEQKLNCIEQGCRDIMRCLSQIGMVYEHSMMDYAVWYRHRHQQCATYNDFIMLMTCNAIVDSEFENSNVQWKIVELCEPI